MSNTFILLAISTSLLFAGCQSSGPVVSEAAPAVAPVAAVAKPVLSEEAIKSLTQAEADIKAAKSQTALWTTAEDALKKAKESAEQKDSAATLKFSKAASKYAEMGLAQKKYPSTK